MYWKTYTQKISHYQLLSLMVEISKEDLNNDGIHVAYFIYYFYRICLLYFWKSGQIDLDNNDCFDFICRFARGFHD